MDKEIDMEEVKWYYKGEFGERVLDQLEVLSNDDSFEAQNLVAQKLMMLDLTPAEAYNEVRIFLQEEIA